MSQTDLGPVAHSGTFGHPVLYWQPNKNWFISSGAQLQMQEHKRDEKGCYLFNSWNNTEESLSEETEENPSCFEIFFL